MRALEGQRERVRAHLRRLRAAADAVELWVDNPSMGVDVESTQVLADTAIRLVSDTARLYQMGRDDRTAPPQDKESER